MTTDRLQWSRDRAWLQAEMDSVSEDTSLYAVGYWTALSKVYARMFLTEEERAEVARVGREMFG